MSKSIRIRTTPNGDDKFVKINMEQDFDFVEILSLKLTQKELYTKFCADYGVIVGRVTVNNGFGVPNAKVSVFVPISEDDKLDPEIYGEYPFETIADLDSEGVRYNLLSGNNDTNDECYTPVGTFPNKRQFLDDDEMLDVYCKYYKFTTTTNASGDYMIFGVPSGAQIMYAEADMSDIGAISQKPYDYIRLGSSSENFDSTSKFRKEDNLDAMNHIINRSPIGLDVQPFWGDEDNCNVMITRRDIDMKVRVTPSAIFTGSIFGDNEENSINTTCRPRNGMGVLDGQTTGRGKIEMIRKTIDGAIERFDVKGGELIDKDGVWAYQVPMNIDYRVTDEYGDLVPTDDPNKGIPTRADVRFRIGMNVTGGEGKLRTRGQYLVPHNPDQLGDVDFEFGPQTKPHSFATLKWNTIYTVKNLITRYEHTEAPSDSGVRSFVGIKDVDSARGKYTPFPFNRLHIASDALFNFICGLVIALSAIIILINVSIIRPINDIISVINGFLDFFGVDPIAYIACITLDCQNRPYAPGCDNGRPGCTAAGGPPNGSTYCVGSTEDNGWDDTDIPGDAGYTHCVASSLVEDLNLLKFDFYNDWINGTLYAPLFKFKSSKLGEEREKFCEWTCGGGGVNNLNPSDSNAFDNNCYNDVYLIETCVYHGDCSINTVGSRKTNEGFIEKNGDNLYYVPYSRNLGSKLYASDLVTLGSSVKCHYDGLPFVQDLWIDTTYKMPPLLPEYSLVGNHLDKVTSGLDSPSKDMVNSLFVDINCISIQARSQQCGNIRRQCELGVGLDDFDEDAQGLFRYPNQFLTNEDIDVHFSRNVFAWMNNETLFNTYPTPNGLPPADVNCDWLDAQFSIDYNETPPNQYVSANGPDCGDIIGTDDYNIFRYNNIGQTLTTNRFPRVDDSFYFYFGLNAASTALSQLREKYFAPCPVLDDPNYVVIGDVTHNTTISPSPTTPATGGIDISVIGGTDPYTFHWTYPDGTVHTYTGDNQGGDIEELVGGAYTLTVIDNGGVSVTTTFIVDDPAVLSCFVEGFPLTVPYDPNSQQIPDGSMSISVNGGATPYTITIEGANGTIQTLTTTNNYETISNLPPDVYTITIEDGDPTTPPCPSTVTITEPFGLNFVVNSVWDGPPNATAEQLADPNNYLESPSQGQPTCHDTPNGVIFITPLGGEPPYSVTVTCPATFNPLPLGTFSSTDFNNINLGWNAVNNLPPHPEWYQITVTDSANDSVGPIPYDIANPSILTPTYTTVPEDQGNDGSITVHAPNANYPYTYYLDGNPEFNVTLINHQFENLSAGDYEIKVVDNNGCVSETVTVTVA